MPGQRLSLDTGHSLVETPTTGAHMMAADVSDRQGGCNMLLALGHFERPSAHCAATTLGGTS